jgi:hypothetical protein
VEIVVATNINFIKSGVLIGSIMKLGHGLEGVLPRMNLNIIPLATIRVFGRPYMVFINLIMTTHVNKNAN